MPLRAVREDGTDIVAPMTTPGEWDALRRAVREGRGALLLPCCRGTAYQRTSPRGLRHFYHPPQSDCVHAGETQAHLLGKYEIAAACRESCYTARTEWVEDDWRADVLAARDGTRIAFEIQLTRVSLDDVTERQKRFRRSGVRGCWFCLLPPAELRASAITGDLIARPDLPLFEVEWSIEYGFLAHLNGRRYPLRLIVQALLGERIAFRQTARVRSEPSIAVGFYRVRCWRCAGDVSVYRVRRRAGPGVTECGAEVRWTGGPILSPLGPSRGEVRAAVQAAIRSAIEADGTLATRLAMTRKRSRRIGSTVPPWCFGCPHCGASLLQLTVPRHPDRVIELSTGRGRSSVVEWPHWCSVDSAPALG